MTAGAKVRIGAILLGLVATTGGAVLLFQALGLWGLAGLTLWTTGTNIQAWVTADREREQREMVAHLVTLLERATGRGVL